MALRTAARASQLRLAPVRAITSVLTRGMALDGLKGYPDREMAQENVYFRSEEERALRKLLSKVKLATDKDKTESEIMANRREELAPIKVLLDKYKIADADIDVLLDWKHHHH